MELRLFEDFLALAETLNFSRAAATRNITQPAFSRRIRALEDWVGAPLVARTTHAVSLTPAGQHFRAHAESVTRTIYQARREALEIDGVARTTLTFAATHALSFTFFPDWVRSQDGILPLGALNLLSDSLEACEKLMLRGEVQFLLAHAWPEMRGGRLAEGPFKSKVVGHDVLLPLGAKDVVSRQKNRRNVEGEGNAARAGGNEQGGQGAGLPWLAYSAESGLGRIIRAKWPEIGRDFEENPRFTSPLAATLQSMAKSGAGIAWLPRTLAMRDLENGDLFALGGPDLQIPVEIRLFRSAARQSPAAEALWEAL